MDMIENPRETKNIIVHEHDRKSHRETKNIIVHGHDTKSHRETRDILHTNMMENPIEKERI
jgi:hypothetical protein